MRQYVVPMMIAILVTIVVTGGCVMGMVYSILNAAAEAAKTQRSEVALVAEKAVQSTEDVVSSLPKIGQPKKKQEAPKEVPVAKKAPETPRAEVPKALATKLAPAKMPEPRSFIPPGPHVGYMPGYQPAYSGGYQQSPVNTAKFQLRQQQELRLFQLGLQKVIVDDAVLRLQDPDETLKTEEAVRHRWRKYWGDKGYVETVKEIDRKIGELAEREKRGPAEKGSLMLRLAKMQKSLSDEIRLTKSVIALASK
jgi:hypothetical protein